MSEITIFAEKSIISLKFQENQNFLYFSNHLLLINRANSDIFKYYHKLCDFGTDAVAVSGFRPNFQIDVNKEARDMKS